MNAQGSNPQPEMPSEPSDTAKDVNEVMARLQRAHASLPPKPERDNGPTHKTVASDLLRLGYPSRAVERLDSMFGPGLDKANELLPMVIAGDCILILFGDRGPGKTQMATRWAFERGMKGKSVGRYIKTFDVLAKIKDSWGEKGRSEADVLKSYQKTPFLVLDEFQERSDRDWDNRTLVNILDHRYDERLTTILIANLATKKDCIERIPASIISRAEEVGGLVPCDWPSYRQLDLEGMQ